MKKISCFIALFGVMGMSCLSAQGIQFTENEKWATILAKAKKEKKMIFMDAYTSWCGPCKMLAAQIFPQPEVGAFYNENFINTHYDMEKDEGIMLANTFGVNMYPTLLIIDADGKIVTRTAGFMQAPALIDFGRGALGKAEKVQDWVKKYDAGDHSSETLRGYALSLRRSGASSVKIANEYLATQTDLKTPENLKFIFNVAERFDSKIFELLLENKTKIIELVGKEPFEAKIRGAASTSLGYAVEFKSLELLRQAQKTVKKHLGGSYASEFEATSTMEFYKKTGDEAAYVKAAKPYVDKVIGNDMTKLNAFVQVLGQTLQKSENFVPVVKWAKRVASKAPSYEHSVTYAALLLKTGDKKEAARIAQKAIGQGSAAGIPTTTAQQILEKAK